MRLSDLTLALFKEAEVPDLSIVVDGSPQSEA